MYKEQHISSTIGTGEVRVWRLLFPCWDRAMMRSGADLYSDVIQDNHVVAY